MQSIIKRCIEDQEFRIAAVSRSHFLFFHVYFAKHIRYPTAPFQKQIIKWTEQKKLQFLVISAFRGSAKSTICTMSLPIWAILGRRQKKSVLILCKTQEQVKRFMSDILTEIKFNELLKMDRGPFQFEEDEQRRLSIELGQYGAKIIGASTETTVRGLKYGSHRPDLIICDDLEDTESVRSQESRDKLYKWFMGEVVPLGDRGTNYVMVGNVLHRDGLLKRLEGEIMEKKHGIAASFPFFVDGKPIWPSKFKTQQDIDILRNLVDEPTWLREYLLQDVADATQLVRPEWIKFYDELPQLGDAEFIAGAVGIDLAFSKEDRADFTAMVAGKAYYVNNKMRVYITLPMVHTHATALEVLEAAKSLARTNATDGNNATLVVENVHQDIFIQLLEQAGFYTKSVHPTTDKGMRLSVVTPLLQGDQVFFPRTGAETLINELLDFGKGGHDDLADAFVHLLSHFMDFNQEPPPSMVRWGPPSAFRDGSGRLLR